MRLLHQDAKTGEIKLLIESLDDLWHLKNLINPKDMVWANTTRRADEKGDKLRSDKPEKKHMRLGIRVEKIELQEFQDKIRILGVIEGGQQDIGHHHTLLLGTGDTLSIFKSEWKRHELERVKQALEQSAKPSIYFIALDDTEASAFVMTQFAIKEIGNASRTGMGKMFESKSDQSVYFEEIVSIISPVIKNEPLVILGPGFAKEALITYMREKHPDIAKNATIVSSAQSGATGVSEIIKKGLGGKVLEVARISVETKLMEEVLTRIKMNQPVAYGQTNVEQAVKAGAVETLLITEKEVRTLKGEELMKNAEDSSGKVEIISTTHDAGKQLESFGGFAALLRYKISE